MYLYNIVSWKLQPVSIDGLIEYTCTTWYATTSLDWLITRMYLYNIVSGKLQPVLIDWLIDWLFDCYNLHVLTDWLIDWLMDWLIDLRVQQSTLQPVLIGWLIARSYLYNRVRYNQS